MKLNYTQTKFLIEMDEAIQKDNKGLAYHTQHIKLAREYALILATKLNYQLNPDIISFIALSHDLFKESGLNKSKDGSVKWNDINIPQDLNRYVRMNLHVLEPYHLDDYFNTDIQLHALAAGIFLIKEFEITDPLILYPIFFHSCPIYNVYKDLDKKIQTMVDIMMLADKLSSNYLRINMTNVKVRVDLDKIVFGDNGNEFNFTLGLVIARLISQGKHPDKQSIEITNYYHNKLKKLNPLVNKHINYKSLGGLRKWPKRVSQVLKTQ